MLTPGWKGTKRAVVYDTQHEGSSFLEKVKGDNNLVVVGARIGRRKCRDLPTIPFNG